MDQDNDLLRAENDALRAENAGQRRLLAKHQWSGLTPSKSGGVCPECCASRRSGHGHRPGCAIAATLGLGNGSEVLLPV
jgi:hypothetical protein